MFASKKNKKNCSLVRTVWGIEDVEADHQQRGHIGVWTMEVVDGKQEVLKSLSQPLQRKEKRKRKNLSPDVHLFTAFL